MGNSKNFLEFNLMNFSILLKLKKFNAPEIYAFLQYCNDLWNSEIKPGPNYAEKHYRKTKSVIRRWFKHRQHYVLNSIMSQNLYKLWYKYLPDNCIHPCLVQTSCWSSLWESQCCSMSGCSQSSNTRLLVGYPQSCHTHSSNIVSNTPQLVVITLLFN